MPEQPIDGEIICGDQLSHCTCTKEPGHDGPHLCDRDDGSWTYDNTGNLRIVAFPNPFKLFESS